MSLSAEHTFTRNRTLLLGRLAIEFPMNFFKYYIGRHHFTGGLMGLRYALTHSSFRVLKVYRLWRKKGHPKSAPIETRHNNNEIA
jgi:hypothetical protein